jgi:autotransporter-associated beta strand protein
LTAPPIPQALIYWLEPVSGGGATADYTVSGSYTSGDNNPAGGYKVSINSLPAPSATIKFNLYASIGGYDTNAANDTFISGLLDILNRPAPGSALPGQPGPVSLVAAFTGAAGYSSGQANRDVDGGGGVDLGGDLAIATPPTATGDVWVRPKNASTGVAGTSRNANGRTDVLIGSFFYTLGAGVSGGQSAQVWTAAVVNTGAGGTNSANSWRKDGTYTKREEYGTNVGSAPAVTILVPATVSIGSSVTHQEGDVGTTDYVFPVTLSKPCTQPVQVTVDTSDGTATTADNDYQTLHQVVTFAPGETSKNVTVRVNGDMRLESDESFTVTLSAPLYSGAAAPGLISLGNSVGAATIVNDDQAGLVWIAPLSADVLEGNQGTTPLTFTVGLSSPSDSTITVDVDTADGTATVANNDYQPLQHYTVTLNPGQMSAKVTVTALGDAVLENDETFTVGLSNLTGTGYALGRSTATGTILNDDGALVLGDSGSSLLIVADPASPNVAQMFFNGAATPTYRIDTTRVWDAAGLRRFVLQGGAGDDLLTLDFAYDPALGVRSPLPADGLIFTGGGSVAGDSLVWKNSTGTLVASPYPAAPEVPTGIQLTSATTPTVTLDNVGFVSFQLADCVQNNNCLTLDGVRLTVNQDNAISANTAVEVKSGGVLDLGNRTASVRSLTLTDGRVINGSLQSAASTLGNGEVGARLTGGSVTKNGTGTVVLSGQNSYTGGTQVVSQTLVVTSADALPKGGDLTIGPGATLVLPVGLIGSAGAGRAVAAAAVALPNPTPVAATAPAASVMAVSVQPALQPVAIVAPATIAAAAAGAPAPIPVALRATASPAASHSTIAATPRTPAIISAKRIPKVTAAHGTKRTAAHDAALAAHKTVDAVPESWLALVEQAVLSRRPSRETGHAPPGVDAVLAAYGL